MKKTLFGWSVRFAPVVTGLAVIAFSTVVQAATAPTNIITNSQDVVNLFCGAMNWMFWGLMTLGGIMFLVGGYIYATSSGESEKVSKATKTLTYAAIAMVVGLAAKGMPLLVASFFTSSSGGVSTCP